MDYYLVTHEKTRRKLKCTLLSEKSQCKKATYCLFATTWHSAKCEVMEIAKRSVFARSRGKEG